MGCTSSNRAPATKEGTVPSTVSTSSNDGQQLINDHFRKWLKANRPRADEYVLHDVISTAPASSETEDYRTIVGKALDLLAERHDIKSATKLGKLVQKEVTLASPKKVSHTIDILKQTADKLRDGKITLDSEQHQTTLNGSMRTSTNGEVTTVLENKHVQATSGEPGIALREALEKARVLFYKGKQAAIFANPSGGYDVRVLNDSDDTLNHDGNLLRSIIVTEVKMRPKHVTSTTTSPHFVAPPPPPAPPPSKPLDEHEIGDDFRRSIDAALKGLEAIYQKSSVTPGHSSSEHAQQIHVDKTTTTTTTTIPKIVQYGVTNVILPKSTSKEQTTMISSTTDESANLAEIIRQMAEQQKVVSRRLSSGQNQPLIQPDIQPKLVGLVDNMNELMMDAIETTTRAEIGSAVPPSQYETVEKLVTEHIERIVKELKEHGEKHESDENLLTTSNKHSSSYSIGLTSPLHNNESSTTLTSSPSSSSQQKGKLRHENRPKSFVATDEVLKRDGQMINKQMSLDELAHLTQTGLSNPNLNASSNTKLGTSTSSAKIEEEQQRETSSKVEPLTKMPTSISQIIEEHAKILATPSQSSTVAPVETRTKVKSPGHNVTYTEIIHSESKDGEQSRRLVTESYDEKLGSSPLNHDDEQTTTLKVITKSEFSNHPSLGEKIMEQSVQVITVKVRNETIKTTIQQSSAQATDNEVAYERRPVSELVKNFEVVGGDTT